EVEVAQPLVAIDADLAREAPRRAHLMAFARLRLAARSLREHELQVVLLVDPAGGQDRVPVAPCEDLIVAAHAVLPARQRTPGVAALPDRRLGAVRPAADRSVARRLVDLVDGLRPRAAALRARHRSRLEPLVAGERQHAVRLVAPVLTPVLLHHRSAAPPL